MSSNKKRMFILPKETNAKETVKTDNTRLFINTVEKQLLNSQLSDVIHCIGLLNEINNLGIEITPFGLYCSPRQYNKVLTKLQQSVNQN